MDMDTDMDMDMGMRVRNRKIRDSVAERSTTKRASRGCCNLKLGVIFL